MEFIAEIIVNLLLLLGIWLVRWCASHKNITLMILATTVPSTVARAAPLTPSAGKPSFPPIRR